MKLGTLELARGSLILGGGVLVRSTLELGRCSLELTIGNSVGGIALACRRHECVGCSSGSRNSGRCGWDCSCATGRGQQDVCRYLLRRVGRGSRLSGRLGCLHGCLRGCLRGCLCVLILDALVLRRSTGYVYVPGIDSFLWASVSAGRLPAVLALYSEYTTAQVPSILPCVSWVKLKSKLLRTY